MYIHTPVTEDVCVPRGGSIHKTVISTSPYIYYLLVEHIRPLYLFSMHIYAVIYNGVVSGTRCVLNHDSVLLLFCFVLFFVFFSYPIFSIFALLFSPS